MLFDRVKPLTQILETAEKKGLKRQLGGFQLTMLGVGAIIGTGIFVLTSVAANKAGPGMMYSFVIAAVVCALTALVYAEIASMIPVAGSAYTYSYAVMGELIAWTVGWALILEYAVAASAVAVGWSGYINGVMSHHGLGLPPGLMVGSFSTITLADGTQTTGSFNLMAFLVSLLVTWLLVIGTSKSAKVTSALVLIKIAALTAFVIYALPETKQENFSPMLPLGWNGVSTAAASIFFAYVGFDAVSTAAEETINPKRNIPIGLIGSLAICTIFYLLVAYAAVGSVGAQPGGSLSLSNEPLAFVLRELNHPAIGDAVAAAASIALPSVVLMMIYGQTRILFNMSRDGLMPKMFSKVHPKYHTPHVITWITGILVALFASQLNVDVLADISNAGTLYAFLAVAVGVMILRVTQPDRERSFKTPFIWVIGPLAAIGCMYLFYSLGGHVPLPVVGKVSTKMFFVIWAVIGLVVYYAYARSRSLVGKTG
jgi:basic amino acid/polyamine antiporter, APA family